MSRIIDIVWIEQEGFTNGSVLCTGGRQMAVMCGRKQYRFNKCTDDREVDFHHMGRISSKCTAGSRDERSNR